MGLVQLERQEDQVLEVVQESEEALEYQESQD